MDTEEGRKMLDEAKAFVLMVDKQTLATAVVALMGFMGTTIPLLRSGCPEDEVIEKIRRELAMVAAAFPIEVAELIVGVVIGKEVTSEI